MAEKVNYIQKIIDQIITKANLGGLPAEEEKAFRAKLEAQITRRLGLIIMKNLDEKGLKEYEKISKVGEPKPAELEKLLKKYIPDYKEKLKSGMAEMIEEIILALA